MRADTIELDVQPEDEITVYRHLLGKTARDSEIESMPIPKRPLWLWFVVSFVRLYQKKLSGKIGHRCVFNPSCSHYAEIAFRKKGMVKGAIVTTKRLYRCRPSNGGIDELI
jgi:putative membrane protein insertion efficiency factor